jgi:hypothetical protein
MANKAMQDREFTAKLVEQGYVLLAPELTGPAALAEHTRKEGGLWRKVIAEANIPTN